MNRRRRGKKRKKVENVSFADKRCVMAAKYDHEDGTKKSKKKKK